MDTCKQLTIVPETELKLLEVPPTDPESWSRPKEKPLFPGAIEKVAHIEEIQHLSDRKGARRVDETYEGLLRKKAIKIIKKYNGCNLYGDALAFLKYVLENNQLTGFSFKGDITSIYVEITNGTCELQIAKSGNTRNIGMQFLKVYEQ